MASFFYKKWPEIKQGRSQLAIANNLSQLKPVAPRLGALNFVQEPKRNAGRLGTKLGQRSAPDPDIFGERARVIWASEPGARAESCQRREKISGSGAAATDGGQPV